MQQYPLVLNGNYEQVIGKISLTEAFMEKLMKDIHENIAQMSVSVEYQLEPEPRVRCFSFSYNPTMKTRSV